MTKLLSDELPSYSTTSANDRNNHIVHYYATNEGYKPLDPPRMAKEMRCPFCGTDQHYTWLLPNGQRSWLCGRVCSLSRLKKTEGGTLGIPPMRNGLEWPLFCDLNGIGDIHYDVCFEKINQSAEKLSFLRCFAERPQGVIVMRGPAGTGKTYACMGLCELFTRQHRDAMFFTQISMMNKWVATFSEETPSGFKNKVEATTLLVIDDFGTREPSGGFLGWFMDVIDSRMQWTNRGTVINTNLLPEKMAAFCGEALSDRLKTSQLFVFSGKSRRAAPI